MHIAKIIPLSDISISKFTSSSKFTSRIFNIVC